jgi:hypothetical protein
MKKQRLGGQRNAPGAGQGSGLKHCAHSGGGAGSAAAAVVAKRIAERDVGIQRQLAIRRRRGQRFGPVRFPKPVWKYGAGGYASPGLTAGRGLKLLDRYVEHVVDEHRPHQIAAVDRGKPLVRRIECTWIRFYTFQSVSPWRMMQRRMPVGLGNVCISIAPDLSYTKPKSDIKKTG